MTITTKPRDCTTLFLDMNSFFASVEQQVQPPLRGQPVGVAPYTGGTGCIIAASKEAKFQGVKIGLVSEAKKLCPGIKIIEARPALYMLYHNEIKQAIESLTPYHQALSVDEFKINLTPNDQNWENSIKLGNNLKRAIKEKVGDYLTCSVGVGASTFLAKMAGERKKPDGLNILELKNLTGFYSVLKLTDLTGINYRMEDRLKKFKIYSPLDFYNCSLERLIKMLGHWGRLWYFRLRGYEVDDYIIKNKTIGHSHVLSPEFRTKEGALAVLKKLISKTGYRLRKENYWAGGVSLSVGFLDGGGFHQSKKTALFCDNRSFTQNAYSILKNCRWQGRPNYLAVSSFNLVKNSSEQISIFKDIEKSKALSKTLDEINDEFGADTVFSASSFLAKDLAPDRIPFGRPRYEIRH